MNKYDVSWKGRVVGRYSFEEIKTMSELGRIGLLYMVEVGPGKWVFVRDFLSDVEVLRDNGWETENVSTVPCGSFPDEDLSGRRVNVGEPLIRRRHGDGGSFMSVLAPFVYALCGGAFLSAYLYAASMFLAAVFYFKVSKREGVKLAALSSALFAAGLAFFKCMLPILEK